MGFYYPSIQELNALNDAANSLRGAAEDVPVTQQIRHVAQELFKGREAKYINPKEKLVPEEAKIVFDEIYRQMQQIRESAADLIKDESITTGVIDDIKILGDFADRVFDYYNAGETPLAQKIKKTMAQMITDGSAGMEVIELRNQVHDLVDWYINSTELSKEEFQDKLEEIATHLKKIPANREKPLLWAEIHRLRTELDVARRLYLVEEPPAIAAEHAINLLRIASDMVQASKTFPEIIKALEIGDEANRHLKNAGETFLEKAEKFNLIFSEKINLYLRKQIMKLREKLNRPLYFVAKDTTRTEEIFKEMSRQKAKIRDYYDLAETTGEHREDLQELLVELTEKINRRIEKMLPHLNSEQAAKFKELL